MFNETLCFYSGRKYHSRQNPSAAALFGKPSLLVIKLVTKIVLFPLDSGRQ